MANRYWRGGAGTWNTTSTTNWSATSGGTGGASVPTASDSVFFDQAGTYTVTMTGALLCLDITVSAGTVTFSVGTTPTLAVSGSMSLLASTVWGASVPITFKATTTGKTITTNGASMGSAITFDGVGGEWSLGNSITLANTLTTTLTNGSLVLNGFNLTTGIFSSNNSNTRSINFGATYIFPTFTGTAVSMATTTGLTVSGAGGFSFVANNAKTFNIGSTANNGLTGAPNLFVTAGGGSTQTITANSWINSLYTDPTATNFTISSTNVNLQSITCSSQLNVTYAIGITARGTGTFTIPSGSLTFSNLIVDNSTGTTTLGTNLILTNVTAYTHTSGTLDCASFNVNCSTSGATATFASGTISNIGTFSISNGTFTQTGTFNLTSGTLQVGTYVLTSGTFNFNGGTLQSGAGLFTTAFTHTAGTINLNNNNLNIGSFTSTTTSTRTINFGSTGSITLNSGSAINMSTMTGLTMTGSRIFYTSSTRTTSYSIGITAGGYTTNGVNLVITGSGTNVHTFTTGTGINCFFDSIDFGTYAGTPANAFNVNSLVLSSTMGGLGAITFLGSGSINTNTRTVPDITINHSGTTTLLSNITTQSTAATITHTSGALNLNGFNITTGTWTSSNTNTRSIAFGSNYIFLVVTTAGTNNVSMANATGFTATGTGGFSAAMSITRGFNVGTAGAPTVAPNLFLTSGASVPTLTTAGFFGNLDFTGSTCNPGTTALSLTGLVLATGGTYTGITATMIGSGTVNGNGKTIAALTINHSQTTTITGNLTTSSNTTLTQGGIVFSDSSTLTVPSFISVGPTTRSITGNGTITVSSAWTVTNGTGFTGTGYTIRMTSATAKTFAGGTGNATYGTLIQAGAGALTISGSSTFDDIQATTIPSTITFTAGTTQTLANLTLSGTAGNLIVLNSTINGTQFNLSKSSGTVITNYLNIRDSNATGGATFYAQTSTNTSNNSGWIFALAKQINGQFMAFF